MKVYDEFSAELERAKGIHGDQGHLPDMIETGSLNLVHGTTFRLNCDNAFARGNGSWAHILTEELGEALDEAREGNVKALREELVQVGAMVAGWIEAIDGRAA